jgi:adenylate cyclase
VKFALPPFRFRTLRGRLVGVFLPLLIVLQAATFALVLNANRRNALRQIDTDLETGARIFTTLKNQRIEELSVQARLLAYDYGFKQAFGASADDPATMRLAMQNSRDRIRADFFVLVSLEGRVLFDSEQAPRDGAAFDLPGLIAAAEATPSGETRGLALRDGKLFAVVVVPLLAPDPEAWICLGFRIDNAFAQELGTLTKQAVSFLQQDAGGKVLASTLPAAQAAALPGARLPLDRTGQLVLAGERFVALLTALDVQNGQAAVLLQRALDAELAPYKRLEIILLTVALLGLALSAAAALAIAKSVTQPLLRLAQNTRRVEQGDYTTAPADPDATRGDEIGLLSQSFRKMTAGLAERDHVRDLLGKVTSPAIAAELTRRGLALGGEEKKVTILFSDLRDFTPLSERLTPSELLEILNRYFTRMSQIVDARGGVVDKYIGDALMALFGAPLEQPDQAARAMAAALEMRAALTELNRELFPDSEYTLRFGIGIHTATVVAGNIGSPQRYNYTVIGDGVNAASRLESLTRQPEYATDIIVSAATLADASSRFVTRDLGAAAVKGKEQGMVIHALLGPPVPV